MSQKYRRQTSYFPHFFPYSEFLYTSLQRIFGLSSKTLAASLLIDSLILSPCSLYYSRLGPLFSITRA